MNSLTRSLALVGFAATLTAGVVAPALAQYPYHHGFYHHPYQRAHAARLDRRAAHAAHTGHYARAARFRSHAAHIRYRANHGY